MTDIAKTKKDAKIFYASSSLPDIPDILLDGMKILLEQTIESNEYTFLDKLSRLYSFMDEFNAFVSTFSVCKKGCAHCCKFDVNISRFEAEYIAINTNSSLEIGISKSFNNVSECPFLTHTGVCSIYEFRPFNCRTLHTLDDPNLCIDGKTPHILYGASGMGYGVGFYISAAEWIKDVNARSRSPYRDIRDWFPQKRRETITDKIKRYLTT